MIGGIIEDIRDNQRELYGVRGGGIIGNLYQSGKITISRLFKNLYELRFENNCNIIWLTLKLDGTFL